MTRTIKPSEYDAVVELWKEWQTYPWGKLLYTVVRNNLQRHLDGCPLRILDVGGGNGFNAVYFAKMGHAVTLLDYSPRMLEEARQNAEQAGLLEQINFVQADVNEIHAALREECFDLILCHLMLEFVSDPEKSLHAICQHMAPGGLISVLDANRFSEVYRKAFQAHDLSAALDLVGVREYFHPWFNCVTPLFSSAELSDILWKAGCELVGDYGVLCLCAYLPNEPKFDETYFQQLEKLELELATTYPYTLLARFYQLVAQKKS